MDENQPEQRRVEVKHLRFADAHEEVQHDLRERVAYYVPPADPSALLVTRHVDLVMVERSTLEALLGLLDHHGDGRCVTVKQESEAHHRGYEAGYKNGREDLRDGFDALGVEDEEE